MYSFERKRTSESQALKIAVMQNVLGSLRSFAANQLSLSDLEQSFSQVSCGL